MKPIEQYQRSGLKEPITIRPGLRFHLLLWGGGSLLIIGCIYAVANGDAQEKLVGAFGLILFGFALVLMISALLRSRRRGVFQISHQGIYMAHLDVLLPWEDIGPAWIAITKHAGGKTKDVAFLLRNVSQHSAQMGNLGRWLMGVSIGVARSTQGGLVDWGLKALLFASDADTDMYDQLAVELDRVRKSVMNEPDSTVFNVPVAFRFGISAEDLLVIINHEVALRHKLLPKVQ